MANFKIFIYHQLSKTTQWIHKLLDINACGFVGSGSGNIDLRDSESLHYLKTGRTNPVKGNHILKNFTIPRLDLTTLNVAPLMALVTIYSSVILCNSLGGNGTLRNIHDQD